MKRDGIYQSGFSHKRVDRGGLYESKFMPTRFIHKGFLPKRFLLKRFTLKRFGAKGLNQVSFNQVSFAPKSFRIKSFMKAPQHNALLAQSHPNAQSIQSAQSIHKTQKHSIMRFFLLCLAAFTLTTQYALSQSLNFLELNPQYKPYMQHAILQNYMEDFINIKLVKHKWKRRKDLRIRVFGDSHVASDFITHELRKIMGGTNAVGFAYPIMPPYHQTLLLTYTNEGFALFDSRKPSDYSDYPMGGIVAYPEVEGATLTIQINKDQIRAFTNTFVTQIVFKSKDIEPAFRITDSSNTTHILHASSQDSWEIAHLELKFPITIEALSLGAQLGGYFIYKEKESSVIEHLGVNGVRSDIWKKWNPKILEEELQILDYDIIMLCYGSNDAVYNILKEERFIANYREFIAMLKRTNPNAIIILMSPPPVLLPVDASKNKYQPAQTFLPVKEAITKVAQLEQIMLFDIDEFIEKNGTKDSWTKHNLSKKDVHLTPQGYRLIAHGIYQALNTTLKQH